MFALLLAPFGWLLQFLAYHYVFTFFIVMLIAAFIYSSQPLAVSSYTRKATCYSTPNSRPGSGTSTPQRKGSPDGSVRKRRVSLIKEVDENECQSDGGLERPKQLEARRMRKRDWARQFYKSLMQQETPPGSTPSSSSSQEALDKAGGRERTTSMNRPLRRRHSLGPLQIAKEFMSRRRSSMFRPPSEGSRTALPRPPTEFFEPSDLPEIPQNLQPEIFYILHNLKMLELPSSWKLDPRDIEVRDYKDGDYIVRPGDSDDSIIVSLEGMLNVYITHQESGKQYMVKRIYKGNSFFSLLSMLDIMMKNDSRLRTVSLRSEGPSRVAVYKIHSFRDNYLKDPSLWSRPIQIVITRLLHVTMTTLHQYMGLSTELMKQRVDAPMHRSDTADRFRHGSGQSMKTASGGARGARAAAAVGGGTGQPGREHAPAAGKDRRPSCDADSQAPQLAVSSSPADVAGTARKWLGEALGIVGDEAAVAKALEARYRVEQFEEGDVLVEQGSEEEQLIMPVQGILHLMQEPAFDDRRNLFDDAEGEEENTPRWTSQVGHKELVGGLQLLTNEPSFYTVKAATRVTCVVMDKIAFHKLLEEHPEVYLPVAHSILRRLSPFLRGVDFALDWVLVDSGHAVYRKGDHADSLYVVLSGRLRSVEKKTVIEEFGRGDMLGMMEVLQRKQRDTTVLAVRFSQLARIPEGLLNFIKLKFPQVGFRLVHLLGHYYSSINRRQPTMPAAVRSFDMTGADPMSHIKNLHTIAVVPASPDVPLVEFTCELYHALNANLRVLRLSSHKVASYLDSSVLEKQADFRLMHWLNVQEDTYPLVIYECDYTSTNWTRRCLRQADAILVVGMGNKKPNWNSQLEDHLNMNQDGIRTNKELILLWPEDTVSPSGTYEWLKGSWFSGHHHLRCPQRMFRWRAEKSKGNPVSEREIIEYYEQNVFWDVDNKSDFARLGRILTGNAIGLVLGGGGARGAAHVGVIRAMREHGIPVDLVGGTSIGSMVGGLFADSPNDCSRVEERARSWFDGMTSLWRKIWDLTYAHSAMFTGAQFNRTLQLLFGEKEIEDLWIPYFCISTDISTSEMRVHRSGPMWAYIRASMSLAGYLPPLCDPQDGHLLLDGGYVNNLPADVMRSMGARCVVAVDVGSVTENDLTNYGDSLSGTWVLMRKLNPWAEQPRVLNMEEIQSRLAFVSCVRQLEQVKKASYCQYLRPDVTPWKTLEFGKYDTILDVGYVYGSEKCLEMVRTNENLRAALGLGEVNMGSGNKEKGLQRQQSRREKGRFLGLSMDATMSTSFTDLAAAMSKVPAARPVLTHSMSAIEPNDYLSISEDEFGLSSSDCNELTDTEEEDSDVRATPLPR